MSKIKVLDYPIELHYSQTYKLFILAILMLDYPIELHYSQTYHGLDCITSFAWLPYRITLLSNPYFS